MKKNESWTISGTRSQYNTQEQAIDEAKKVAKSSNAILVVHKVNGEISERETVDYSKKRHLLPRTFGRRNLSDKKILVAVLKTKQNLK